MNPYASCWLWTKMCWCVLICSCWTETTVTKMRLSLPTRGAHYTSLWVCLSSTHTHRHRHIAHRDRDTHRHTHTCKVGTLLWGTHDACACVFFMVTHVLFLKTSSVVTTATSMTLMLKLLATSWILIALLEPVSANWSTSADPGRITYSTHRRCYWRCETISETISPSTVAGKGDPEGESITESEEEAGGCHYLQ